MISSRFLIPVAAVAALAVGALFLGGRTPGDPFAGAAFAQEAGAVDTSTIVEMQQGNPDAAVTVIEYASYTCPHCADFHEGSYQRLKAEFIDTGKINFVYREVYFDRPGLWASVVARCGGPEKFFGISDMLYKQQRDWARGDDPNAIVGKLRTIGAIAGLEPEALSACLTDAPKFNALVAWFRENAEADEIRSTPSFVINGTRYSNMAYDDMAGIINDALGN